MKLPRLRMHCQFRDVLTPASSITYTYAGLKLDQTAGDLTTLPTGTIDVSPTSNVGDYDIVIGVLNQPIMILHM